MKRNGFALSSSALLAIVYSSSVLAADYKIEEFRKNIIYLDSKTQSENLKSFPIIVKDMNNTSSDLAAQSIKFSPDESLLKDYIQQDFCRKVKFKIANGQLQIVSAPKKINTMMTCYYKPKSTDTNIVLNSKQKNLEIKFNYDFATWLEQPDYLDATKIAKYIDTKINTSSEEITLDGQAIQPISQGDVTLDLSAVYLTDKFPNLNKLSIRNFRIAQHNYNSYAFPKAQSLKHLSYSRNKFYEVKKDSFRRIKNLETLDLRGNYIKKIEDNSFERLKNLRHLDLEYNNLGAITKYTFAGLVNLQELKLSNNTPYNSEDKYTKMELSGNPKLQNLVSLSITNSNVGKIDKIFFQSMPLLSTINLKDNALTEIPENIFANNHFLKEVDLSQNKIQNISSLGNTNIAILNLSKNKIESINDSFFNSIQKIEVLNLSMNSIHTFDKTILSEQLKVVNLGNNKLTFIPNLLSINLENLNIAQNNIEQLNGDELNQYTKLNSIDIFDNKLAEIPAHTFKSQSILKDLNLAKNNFTEVPVDSFQHLASLETLDLSYNSLQSINPNSFDGLSSLKHLYLDHNEKPLAFNIDHNIVLDSISIQNSVSNEDLDRVEKLFAGTPQITIHNDYDY